MKRKNKIPASDSKNSSKHTFTSLKKARKVFWIILFLTFSGLLIFEIVFSPAAPRRPHLIPSLQKDELLNGVNWYAENAIGSLNLPDSDTCTISAGQNHIRCSAINHDSVSEISEMVSSILKNKNLWKEVWYPGSPLPEEVISFSIYSYKFTDQISVKKEPNPLNDITVLTLLFKRTGFSSLFNEIQAKHPDFIEKNHLEVLQSKLNKDEEITLTIHKHPMGYYFPVPRLPKHILPNKN